MLNSWVRLDDTGVAVCKSCVCVLSLLDVQRSRRNTPFLSSIMLISRAGCSSHMCQVALVPYAPNFYCLRNNWPLASAFASFISNPVDAHLSVGSDFSAQYFECVMSLALPFQHGLNQTHEHVRGLTLQQSNLVERLLIWSETHVAEFDEMSGFLCHVLYNAALSRMPHVSAIFGTTLRQMSYINLCCV